MAPPVWKSGILEIKGIMGRYDISLCRKLLWNSRNYGNRLYIAVSLAPVEFRNSRNYGNYWKRWHISVRSYGTSVVLSLYHSLPLEYDNTALIKFYCKKNIFTDSTLWGPTFTRSSPPPMKQMISTITYWLTYDHTASINFYRKKSIFTGNTHLGPMFIKGPPPKSPIKQINSNLL